ncbi:hypothetical protein Ae717Ps2_3923c [Pseudonocardia sp. Ae717_Ps2]|uniref:hypothetical protein n=1 Tax=Pseudonocardia sp. Ae717_Ps2 TaxID=1885573 RepID=UPI00094AE2D8|nr:hypothetical protein [Pseudonocardia sp. Ae717_Ps2]OLM33027.1 hypothetical protein Ae717Ps2_3923c [Pseudonocardia sp. Ae717_Ps2]
MSAPPHPESPEPGAPSPRVLAGLAHEVDVLLRRVDGLDPLTGRVDRLEEMAVRMADTVKSLVGRKQKLPAPSWLLAPTEPADVAGLLDELTVWLGAVFLRYPDGASVLPECWLWHPDVVEELLWLAHAWLAAYQGPDASVSVAGDWHDRQRPGVVARVRKSAGSCSIERHQTRPGWSAPAGAPVPVPGLEHAAAIAEWWARSREQSPPEPAPAAAGPIGGALR